MSLHLRSLRKKITKSVVGGPGGEQLVAAAEAREASLNASEEKLQALRVQLERDAKAHAEEAKSAVRRLKVQSAINFSLYTLDVDGELAVQCCLLSCLGGVFFISGSAFDMSEGGRHGTVVTASITFHGETL